MLYSVFFVPVPLGQVGTNAPQVGVVPLVSMIFSVSGQKFKRKTKKWDKPFLNPTCPACYATPRAPVSVLFLSVSSGTGQTKRTPAGGYGGGSSGAIGDIATEGRWQ